jgi:hypothetical protein
MKAIVLAVIVGTAFQAAALARPDPIRKWRPSKNI